MPVYYSSIIEEHLWTRKACGIFDVSHLGEFHLKGKGAFDYLQSRITNDLRKVKPYQILYSLLCDERGNALDDILVYCGEQDDFYIVVNASNIDKDFRALTLGLPAGLELKNNSDNSACVALQGPDAEKVMEEVLALKVRDMNYYEYKVLEFGAAPAYVSRSGYTGEDGFEVFTDPKTILNVWDRLIEAGKSKGILPCGLGARNTLRLEAGNPLYGHEMDENTTPLEAGLGFAVSLEKGNFTGRQALVDQKAMGLARRLAGFKMLDKSIARDGYAVFSGDQKIGQVTSGSFAPSVNAGIGMAHVQTGFEKVGTSIQIEIHGRKAPAQIIKRPFVEIKHKK